MSLITVDVPEIDEISEVVISCSLLMVGTTKIITDGLIGSVAVADISDLHISANDSIPSDFHLGYEWYRDNEIIDGATSQKYQIVNDDANKKLKVVVKSLQPGYEGEVVSPEIIVKDEINDDYGEDELLYKGE